MFGEFLRLRHVNKCTPRIEGVTPHNFANFRNRAFAASRFFTNVPVDSVCCQHSVTTDCSANNTLIIGKDYGPDKNFKKYEN